MEENTLQTVDGLGNGKKGKIQVPRQLLDTALEVFQPLFPKVYDHRKIKQGKSPNKTSYQDAHHFKVSAP